jgi:hypothetical protein
MLNIKLLKALVVDIEKMISDEGCRKAAQAKIEHPSPMPPKELWVWAERLPSAFNGGQKGERYTMFP